MKTSSYITGDNTVAVLAGNINVLASGTDLTSPPGECMLSWQHWTMIMWCSCTVCVSGAGDDVSNTARTPFR